MPLYARGFFAAAAVERAPRQRGCCRFAEPHRCGGQERARSRRSQGRRAWPPSTGRVDRDELSPRRGRGEQVRTRRPPRHEAAGACGRHRSPWRVAGELPRAQALGSTLA